MTKAYKGRFAWANAIKPSSNSWVKGKPTNTILVSRVPKWESDTTFSTIQQAAEAQGLPWPWSLPPLPGLGPLLWRVWASCPSRSCWLCHFRPSQRPGTGIFSQRLWWSSPVQPFLGLSVSEALFSATFSRTSCYPQSTCHIQNDPTFSKNIQNTCSLGYFAFSWFSAGCLGHRHMQKITKPPKAPCLYST